MGQPLGLRRPPRPPGLAKAIGRRGRHWWQPKGRLSRGNRQLPGRHRNERDHRVRGCRVSKSTDRDRTEIRFGNRAEVSLRGFARTTIHPETGDPAGIARRAGTPRPKRPASPPGAANKAPRRCRTRPHPDTGSAPSRRPRAAAAQVPAGLPQIRLVRSRQPQSHKPVGLVDRRPGLSGEQPAACPRDTLVKLRAPCRPTIRLQGHDRKHGPGDVAFLKRRPRNLLAPPAGNILGFRDVVNQSVREYISGLSDLRHRQRRGVHPPGPLRHHPIKHAVPQSWFGGQPGCLELAVRSCGERLMVAPRASPSGGKELFTRLSEQRHSPCNGFPRARLVICRFVWRRSPAAGRQAPLFVTLPSPSGQLLNDFLPSAFIGVHRRPSNHRAAHQPQASATARCILR